MASGVDVSLKDPGKQFSVVSTGGDGASRRAAVDHEHGTVGITDVFVVQPDSKRQPTKRRGWHLGQSNVYPAQPVYVEDSINVGRNIFGDIDYENTGSGADALTNGHLLPKAMYTLTGNAQAQTGASDYVNAVPERRWLNAGPVAGMEQRVIDYVGKYIGQKLLIACIVDYVGGEQLDLSDRTGVKVTKTHWSKKGFIVWNAGICIYKDCVDSNGKVVSGNDLDDWLARQAVLGSLGLQLPSTVGGDSATDDGSSSIVNTTVGRINHVISNGFFGDASVYIPKSGVVFRHDAVEATSYNVGSGTYICIVSRGDIDHNMIVNFSRVLFSLLGHHDYLAVDDDGGVVWTFTGPNPLDSDDWIGHFYNAGNGGYLGLHPNTRLGLNGGRIEGVAYGVDWLKLNYLGNGSFRCRDFGPNWERVVSGLANDDNDLVVDSLTNMLGHKFDSERFRRCLETNDYVGAFDDLNEVYRDDGNSALSDYTPTAASSPAPSPSASSPAPCSACASTGETASPASTGTSSTPATVDASASASPRPTLSATCRQSRTSSATTSTATRAKGASTSS